MFFINIIIMRGKQIEEEYLNLRYKVEGKIKELQSKLSPPPSSNNSNLTSSNLQSPRHPHCRHNCHHHCHHGPLNTAQFLNPNQTEIVNSECQFSISRANNSKNGSVNDIISQALVESLKNQRQINDHIKAINQKIQNISIQNKSYLSEAFSESVTKKRTNDKHYPKILNIQTEKERCYSQMRTDSRPSHNVEPKIVVKHTLKKVRSNPKLTENIHSINNKQSKNPRSKSKSSNKFKSQYFLSFGCPIHSPVKASITSPRDKQVYKDSQHRNKKHEKNHLIESFNQQQRSRKQIINKISHKAFQEYGRN